MKLLLIYDPHGQSNLIPSIEEIESVDKVIFGGDYLDSFDIHPSTQFRVLQRIIELKKKYEDKIILLLGNHDIQYMYDGRVSELKCSGFNSEYFVRFNMLLKHHHDLFQYSWQYERHLFTHAGVSTQITDAFSTRYPDAYKDVFDGKMQLSELINGSKMKELYFIGRASGGSDPFDGIFWIRPKLLDAYNLDGYIQHVGHTNVEYILDRYLNSKTINYYDGLGKVIINI